MPKPVWPDEACYRAARRWMQCHRRPPTYEDWKVPGGRSYPSAKTIAIKFGDWNTFIKRCGLPLRKSGRHWSQQDTLLAALGHLRRTGLLPTFEEWQTATPQHPSSKWVMRCMCADQPPRQRWDYFIAEVWSYRRQLIQRGLLEVA